MILFCSVCFNVASIIFSLYSFLSIWFIVCITFENYIVTFHLSRAVTFCSVIRAKVIVTVFAVCSVFMYLGQFWTTKVVDFGGGTVICTEVDEYRALNRIYFFWDTVVTLFIPSMVTTGLILAILTRNVCLRREKVNLRLSKKQRSLVRITRVLLAISLTFVILSAPSHANKLRHLIITEVFGQQLYSLEDRILQQLFQVIYYLSFCLNFVYYLTWSINFRKEFKRLFGCQKASRRQRRFECLNANVQMIGNLSGNHTEKITILWWKLRYTS